LAPFSCPPTSRTLPDAGLTMEPSASSTHNLSLGAIFVPELNLRTVLCPHGIHYSPILAGHEEEWARVFDLARLHDIKCKLFLFAYITVLPAVDLTQHSGPGSNGTLRKTQ
jgi:hypothetical protein